MESKKKLRKNHISNDQIRVFGAREHNLKNIDVVIPKDTLTVITGPSGSGKSSLALDVLYTEGKRRYMESLSSYARQFLGIVKKPDVDRIEGLCPAIAIEQKTVGHNPRSTVGTITEIYDYLRVLYARIGAVHCPTCFTRIQAESPENITAMLLETFADQHIVVIAPIAASKKGEFCQELLRFFNQVFYRFIIDGVQYKFTSQDEVRAVKLPKTYKHTIDLLIDAIEIHPAEQTRLQEAVEKAFKLAGGVCKIKVGTQDYSYSCNRICLQCATSIPELEPRCFSFNSPIGACDHCHGLGMLHEWPWKSDDPEAWKEKYPDFFGDRYATQVTCPQCYGKRLNPQALAVTLGGENIAELGDYAIKDLLTFFEQIQLGAIEEAIGQGLIREIVNRLTFLSDVGLSYLSLNRSARTLSGGEGQRIRLATQIGSSLSGVLYVLDEPSIGLHQRDNDRLIATLKKLRDQGNTVLVVEHDHDTMHASDYIIDMGPAAGLHGGMVTAYGTPAQVGANNQSLTGAFLSGKKSIAVPKKVRTARGYLKLKDADKNNLKNINVAFPLGVLCGISGVSGSGKSSLIMQELVPALRRELLAPHAARSVDVGCETLPGAQQLDALVVIDQSPIGLTPRSNPATYLSIFNDIRKLFASLPESNVRGYKVGHFSFNVADGRCFDCKGDGVIKVTMHFLPEVIMVCKACKGARYNANVLQILYRGKSIADILAMTALQASEFFVAHSSIAKRLQLLCDVGLGYLALGQPSTTLSGGEAQRIKLVDELAKRGNRTMYILDEPTTGLHTSDIEKLLLVLNRLVDKGNSMIVIEHNLDVLKTADYLIDLGPEGGDEGGLIVAQGTPQQIARVAASHTGRYLKNVL
jgi:excinuclease ABC subunit A